MAVRGIGFPDSEGGRGFPVSEGGRVFPEVRVEEVFLILVLCSSIVCWVKDFQFTVEFWWNFRRLKCNILFSSCIFALLLVLFSIFNMYFSY